MSPTRFLCATEQFFWWFSSKNSKHHITNAFIKKRNKTTTIPFNWIQWQSLNHALVVSSKFIIIVLLFVDTTWYWSNRYQDIQCTYPFIPTTDIIHTVSTTPLTLTGKVCTSYGHLWVKCKYVCTYTYCTVYLQLYQLEYIAWDHYIQSFIFILSTIPSFHSWLQYTYTVPWCLWLPQKYWQNFCFCQQTPIFDIEHTKHHYRHQQALQIIQYLGYWLGMVTRDQKILEKQMCSRAKQQLQQQDMYHQTRAASASWKQIWQWSSFYFILKLAIQLLLQYSNVFIVVCIASFQTMVTVTVTV